MNYRIVNPYEAAIEHWRGQSIQLLPPASNDQIESTFANLGMVVSEDVRKLYASIGGFDNYESDNLWSLWSLERITSENVHRDDETLWFADWLISSHMYGIKYTDSKSSAIFLDHNSPKHQPQQIACSMSEFLAKYLKNPDDVEAWIVE